MELFLFIASIISLAIFLKILNYIIKEFRENTLRKRDYFVTAIGLSSLIFSVLLFLWSFGKIEFLPEDFFVIYSYVLLIQAISLVSIIYSFDKNKKVLYSLIFLIALTPLVFLKSSYIHFIIPLSLLIILLSFLIFSEDNQKTNNLAILYVSVSLLAYLVSMVYPVTISYLGVVTRISFLFFIHFFLKQLHSNFRYGPSRKKETSPILQFLKHFIFIIIMTNFIFIGTVSVHEFGHLVLTKYSNCSDTRIVYELNSFPHTEVNCENISQKNLWISGGILLPILVSIFLFFSGGHSIKEISLQIVGFNLIISYLDILSLGISKATAVFITILGIILSILSLALLARSRTI